MLKQNSFCLLVGVQSAFKRILHKTNMLKRSYIMEARCPSAISPDWLIDPTICKYLLWKNVAGQRLAQKRSCKPCCVRQWSWRTDAINASGRLWYWLAQEALQRAWRLTPRRRHQNGSLILFTTASFLAGHLTNGWSCTKATTTY